MNIWATNITVWWVCIIWHNLWINSPLEPEANERGKYTVDSNEGKIWKNCDYKW